MTFLLAIVLVAVLVVVVTRGSFLQLAQLPVRVPALLFVALGLQVLLTVVDVPDERLDDLGFGLLLASYLLLLAFCALNARITGLAGRGAWRLGNRSPAPGTTSGHAAWRATAGCEARVASR